MNLLIIVMMMITRLAVIIMIMITYGDGAGNTVEENSSVFSLIQMH